MKKLISCVALTASMFTASISQADVILYAASKAGSVMMLSQRNENCLVGKDGWLKLGPRKDSESLEVCWTQIRDKIVVFYEDGDRIEYPSSAFLTLDTETNATGPVGAAL